YFLLSPAGACRAIYPQNPFPESVEIAQYISDHCPPKGKVAILGSEPQIYFYSRRMAATGYICTYPLMEPQPFADEMQKQMAQQIEAASPDYVVFVNNNGSWLRLVESDPFIFNWFDRYRRDHLQIVGLVEMYDDHSEFHWYDGGQTNVVASTKMWLAILKKK
ncbi:MAG TPA: hypothetical protein VFV81_00245, partial [Verrucomicrobiae bacterium]|nr:hypothetical protein [Verrucomicrobiae bacterium]